IADELGPFDAHFLLPAFFEGGRFTKDSVHYLVVNSIPTPVHETEFAKDSVFAYSYSYLPDYVAEKTQGKITADQVKRFLLEDIRKGCLPQLMSLENNQCCVVDGENQADFDLFAQDILKAASQGKKFLFRSAASILTSLANLGPQPKPAEAMAQYVRGKKPGVVIMGSHVKKSTAQLECLLQASNIEGIEVDVSLLLEDQPTVRENLLNDILAKINSIHNAGKTPVVYTSRQELQFPDTQVRLAFGVRVSRLLMDVVRGLPSDIGFLISKGGITSNDTLSDGLNLPTARLLGQILAGVSLVITPPDHPLFPNLPVVLFPGNVGNNDGLATVYQRLSQE
ncbi:MAG: four-carbon acid sugar kinase family protein, partial [Microcoleaceae cyanobacterium]